MKNWGAIIINRLKNGLCKINNKNLVSLSKSQKNENEEIFMNFKQKKLKIEYCVAKTMEYIE